MVLSIFISLLLALPDPFVFSSAIPPFEPTTIPWEGALEFSQTANVSVFPPHRSLWSLPRSAQLTGFVASNEDIRRLTFEPPTCDGSTYGREVQPSSCQEALHAIPRDKRQISFGRRNRGQWNINVPHRVLSSL